MLFVFTSACCNLVCLHVTYFPDKGQLKMIRIILLIAITSSVGNCQIYSNESIYKSLSDLERVIQTEENLVETLKEYLDRYNRTLQKLHESLKVYEDLNATATEDPDKFVENPVQAFILIKRMTVDWDETKKLLDTQWINDLFDELEDPERFSPWPSFNDLEGAGLALLRVQDAYDLKASDLSNGTFNGVHYGGRLGSSECNMLSRLAYNVSNGELAVEWSLEAGKKL